MDALCEIKVENYLENLNMRKFIRKIKKDVIYMYRFYFKNLGLIIRKKIIFPDRKSIIINQTTYFYKDGGKYFLGPDIMFGYKIGGRWKNGYCELQARSENAQIIIGEKTAINNNCSFICNEKIQIGSNCRIGINCCILDFDGHGLQADKRSDLGYVSPVEIGENVWIGNNVTILAGTTIGKNSVVAAGAVVRGKFGENEVIGGVPAEFIKNIG